MKFVYRPIVRFGDVDAAGIVYYPRYFVMLNDVVEAWFAEALDYPFATLVGRDRGGVPLVDVQASFRAASRLGEPLELALGVRALGRSSFDLEVECTAAGTQRFVAQLRHVLVQLEPLRARPLPDPLREKMQVFLLEEPAR